MAVRFGRAARHDPGKFEQALGMREIWPNFFLVGAGKAGTTSAYAYLAQHPQVFFPGIKEPHFFTQVSLSEKRFRLCSAS